MRQVRQLGDETGDLCDLFQLGICDTINSHFQFEIGDDRTEIGITTSFAITINGSRTIPMPSLTATMVLATAISVSLWAWMPRGVLIFSLLL
jgi:hypothetical protein